MKRVNGKLNKLIMMGCALFFLGNVNAAEYTKTNSYISQDGSRVTERVSRTRGTVEENFKQLFSKLDVSNLPSGILLEKGAFLEREAILQKSVSADQTAVVNRVESEKDQLGERNGVEATTAFVDLYAGLFRASQGQKSLPTPIAIQERSSALLRKHKALPLAVSIVEYESVAHNAVDTGLLSVRDGRLQENHHNDRDNKNQKGDYWRSYRFVDAGLVSFGDAMANIDQMVIASDLFLTNITKNGSPLALLSATIEFVGTGLKVQVKPDQPFPLPMDSLNENQGLEMNISVATSGGDYKFSSEVFFDLLTKSDNKPGFSPKPLPVSVIPNVKGDMAPFCELDQVVASESYLGGFGRLNIRAYPSSHQYSDCTELKRILVLVDGFDVLNNRNHDTIWRDFKDQIRYFLDLGYDVVTIDYQVGNDYIQRNGQAFRTFMVDTIPTLLSSSPDSSHVAVIAGSMGGQVANYGLRQAELNGEEHNARLFMTLDTEYEGANIPIGLQLELDFLSFTNDDGIDAILNALNSPAARQLLRHVYSSPTGFYAPHPLYLSTKAEIQALGLPELTRNVSVANGSGTGDRFAGSSKLRLSRVFQPGAFGVSIMLDAYTDHPGKVFQGKVSVLGIPIYQEQADILTGAIEDDVRPGSSRSTPVEIAHEYNGAAGIAGFVAGNMTYELEKHNFVPTESAIGNGFDYAYHEKCNSGHATMTVGNKEVLAKELIAMKNGVSPVHSAVYSTPCGEPEPVPCAQNVAWWDYTFKSPTLSGQFCVVADVPPGETAKISGQKYYLDKGVLCPYPYSNDASGGCRITSMPGGILYDSSYDAGTAEITMDVLEPQSGVVYGQFVSCPVNTTEISSNIPGYATAWIPGYQKVCKLNLGWQFTPMDVELIGQKLFLIQADPCPSGGILDGFGCYMGEAPAGTTPVISGNQFHYVE